MTKLDPESVLIARMMIHKLSEATESVPKDRFFEAIVKQFQVTTDTLTRIELVIDWMRDHGLLMNDQTDANTLRLVDKKVALAWAAACDETQ